MGSSSSEINRTAKAHQSALDRKWQQITASVQDEFSLDLRDAAHLIGFRTFRIGWDWSEHGFHKRSLLQKYVKSVWETSQLGLQNAFPVTAEGELAATNAANYRRNVVEQKLRLLLKRKKVRLYVTDHEMQTSVASGPLLLDETNRIGIEKSAIYSIWNNYRGEDASVDTVDLLDSLSKEKTLWHKRGGKHDWLSRERILRYFMASSGINFSDQEIMRQCNDKYPVDQTLEKNRYADLTATLRGEYSFSVE